MHKHEHATNKPAALGLVTGHQIHPRDLIPKIATIVIVTHTGNQARISMNT
jgi:hypothetical protein